MLYKDEDILDKDGNEIDDEYLRPQRHAKTPELARDFLLNAAMIIFKEQIEKAFREGTARQNAHSIFVCLSSKLLEQRVHIACKEIFTLEKQNKLLEEEEKEKREEEERKERKRTKEKEKKLRRKERLKDKEREKEQKNSKFSDEAILPNLSREVEGSLTLHEEPNNTISCKESGFETGDVDLFPPGSLDEQDVECLDGCTSLRAEPHNCDSTDREIIDHEYENRCFRNHNPRPVHQAARFWKEHQPDDPGKATGSTYSIRSQEGFQCSDNKIGKKYDSQSCSCKPIYGYQEKVESNTSAPRGMQMQEPKTIFKSDYDLDFSKPVNGANRYTQSDYRCELRPRNKVTISHNPSMMDPVNAEVIEDVSSFVKSPDMLSQCKATEKVGNGSHSDNSRDSTNFNHSTEEDKMEVHITPKNDDQYSKDPLMSRISSSDNCSSCLSEGDSNTASSNNGNTESSSISNSEDANLHSERRENLVDTWNDIRDCNEKMKETEKGIDERDVSRIKNMLNLPADKGESILPGTRFTVPSQNMVPIVNTGSYLSQPQSIMFPQMLNPNIPLSVIQDPSTMAYYHQTPVYWSAAPSNGLIPFPNPNHYVYTGPLGYTLNGESPLYMQYGTPLNHSATPFFNSVPVPVFHPFVETNTMSTVDQAQTLQPLEHMKEPEERTLKSMETSRIQDPQTNSDENFSLFHFSGGPGSLSTVSMGDLSLPVSGDHVFGDPTGNNEEKETIVAKEYNLF